MPSVRVLFAFCTIFMCLVAPARAGVLVLDEKGRVHERRDPGVAGVERVRATPHLDVRAQAAAKRRTVVRELKRMLAAAAIDDVEYRERREAYESARDLVKRLPGRRRIEMGAAVKLLERAAAEGWLTVSRLEPLWRTLEVNRRWWTTGPLLAPGRRVSVQGSELVFQYFPGQGLHLHPLANFGKLNGLWSGKVYDDRLETLLDELLALPAERAGGLAWEYYFAYGGGRAPWVSGLAQGTGLQALARAAIRLRRKEEVLPVAARGLGIFEVAPPAGVRLRTGDAAHYLLYSFNRRLRVLNGFVQALVGLHDFGAYANDPRAKQLFTDGERQARREVPRYDTGAWSKYSQARESDLGYHKLVTGFLASLCERTLETTYCSTQENFTRYLREPPVLELVTERLRGGTRGAIRFELSKISTVTVRVARGEKLVHQVVLRMGGGRRSVAWAVPRRAGDYAVRVTATDLAGNTGTTAGTIEVLEPKKRKRRT